MAKYTKIPKQKKYLVETNDNLFHEFSHSVTDKSLNQFVYDQVHQKDFQIDVTDVFFAKEEKQSVWEAASDLYPVANGGTVNDVLKKYVKSGRRNIKTKPERSANERVNQGEVIVVIWENESFVTQFKKIDSATSNEKIYLVAKCHGQSGKLIISLHEIIQPPEQLIFHQEIKFLVGGEEQTSVTFNIDGRNIYALEIQLRPKSDEALKKVTLELNKKVNKSTFISIKAKVSDTRDKISFSWRSALPGQLNTAEMDYLTEKSNRFQLKTAVAIVTYHIYSDGRIEKRIPGTIDNKYKNKYKYIYHDENGKEHEICMVDKITAQKWIKGSKVNGGLGWEKRTVGGTIRYYQKATGNAELIKIPLPINYKKDDVLIKIGDNTNREYINPVAFASMLGAVAKCGYSDFNFNGSTSSDGTGAPSVSHVNGIAFDFRYLRTDKTGNNLHINLEPNALDVARQEAFIDALVYFGYSSFYSYNITRNGKSFILKKSTHLADHNHHLHVRRDNYTPNFNEVKE